jgi:hypothetical protein
MRLHPPDVDAAAIKLTGMPNAFPSLHIGTAIIFVFFAQSRAWRGVSLAFFAATALATISLGEHYVIDLVPGVAFGCYAAFVGRRQWRRAAIYLGVVTAWTLGVRFAYSFMLAHPQVVRASAALTVGLTLAAVLAEWSSSTRMKESDDQARDRLHLPSFS